MEYLIDFALAAWAGYLTWRTYRKVTPRTPPSPEPPKINYEGWRDSEIHRITRGDGRVWLRARLAEKARKRAAK